MGSGKARLGLTVAAALCASQAVATGAQAKGGPKSAEPNMRYEAVHQDWLVTCDICVSYEESVCLMMPLPGATSADGDRYLYLFPSDETRTDPPLAMTFVPTGGLDYGASGTLTLIVDETVAGALTEPDAAYSEMYGELYVEPSALGGLIPALRAGTTLDLTFADAGGTVAEHYSLAGFDAALDDMLSQLPMDRPRIEDWGAFCGN